jgi:hypothetical protein
MNRSKFEGELTALKAQLAALESINIDRLKPSIESHGHHEERVTHVLSGDGQSGLPPKAWYFPSKEENLPPKEGNIPPKEVKLPPKEGTAPPKGGNSSPKAENVPAKEGCVPPKTENLSPTGGNLPPKEGNIPPKEVKLPPKEGNASPKAENLSPTGGNIPPKEGNLPPKEAERPPSGGGGARGSGPEWEERHCLYADLKEKESARHNARDASLPWVEGIIAHLVKGMTSVADLQVIAITSKSVNKSYISPNNLADFRLGAVFSSENSEGQWVKWDFKEKRVRPTHYSIRSGQNSFLQSWVLEGSLDDEHWSELAASDKGTNKDLMGREKIGAWRISADGVYRVIRLTQTGKNHSNNNMLVLDAFEIYGTLLTPK